MAAVQYDVIINYVTKMNGKSQAASKAVAKQAKQATSSVKTQGKFIDKSVMASEKLNNLFGQMRQIEVFKGMGVDAKNFNVEVDKVNSQLGNMGVNQDKMWASAKKMSRGFDMSMLSFMFFGMFLQRIFGQIFNQMLNTFKMIDKKGTMPLSKSITRMSAAVQYLSFSLMRALTPILMPIIETIVTILDTISSLPQPIQQIIGLTILFGLALGTIFFLIGTISLGIGAIVPKTEDLATNLNKISFANLVSGIKSLVAPLLLIALAGYLAYKTFQVLEEFGPVLKSSFLDLSNSFDTFAETFGLDSEAIKIQLALLATGFDTYLKYGITTTMVIFSQALSVAMDNLSLFAKKLNIAKLTFEVFVRTLAGLDSKNRLDQITELVGEIENLQGAMNVREYRFGLKLEELATMQGDELTGRNIKQSGSKSATDFTNAFLEQANMELPLINEQGVLMATSTVEGFTSKSDDMKVTVNDEWGSIMDLMQDITKSSADSQISDMDRIINKLKQLRTEQAKTNISSGSSVTNNKTSNTNYFNVSGNNTSKLVRDVSKAVT